MIAKKLPQKPKIILLANDEVGLKIAKYLKSQKENIVGLVLHPKNKAKLADKIRKTIGIKNIFYADQMGSPDFLEKIKKIQPDIALSMWFGYILKSEFIKLFPSGCINLHNSFLPLNRGKYPHVWAVYNDSKYGVSIHYIDEKIDTGDILIRKEVKVKPTDIAGTLYSRSLEEIVKLFISFWPHFKKGGIKVIKQNNKIATSHFAKDIERLDFIDLNKKYLGKHLINQLRSRSFVDRTYAYFLHKKKHIYIKITLSDKPNFK
ncbi:MAG: formyltransferase family protein [Candidatus Staskawiczbacteria bacterium]|jgi:methionyl-tRNA formyltransferase